MNATAENPAPKPGRHRQWLRLTVDSLALALLVAIVFDAYYYEPNHPQVEVYAFPTAKWPKGAKPVRVVQISDLHLTGFGKREQRAIAALRELNPEVRVKTGDFVGRREELPGLEKFLSQLPPVAIKLAVRGNADLALRMPADEYKNFFARFGVQLLINRKVYLSFGPEQICVIGLDDSSTGLADPKTLRDLDPADFNLMLVHSPEGFSSAVKKHVDLILVGHTHGGQIRIPGLRPFWLPKDTARYADGFYRSRGLVMYTNRGLGTTIFPARFNCRPEIAVFELGAKP